VGRDGPVGADEGEVGEVDGGHLLLVPEVSNQIALPCFIFNKIIHGLVFDFPC